MRKADRREQTTVIAQTAKEFDQLVNDALEAASLREAEVIGIDRRREGGEFIAFIDMVSEVRIAETIMDAYEATGECHHCGECPYLLKSGDRRRRWLACDKGMREQTRYNSPAGLYFYEALHRGEIELSDIVVTKEVRHG